MNIRSTKFEGPVRQRSGGNTPVESSTLSSEESKGGGAVKAGVLIGGSGLVAAAMLNPDKVSTVVDTVGSAIGPTIEAVKPFFQGMGVGGMTGMVTGTGYAMLATMHHNDSTPAFASLGGLLGGAVLGGVTGGIAGAAGVNPLIAIPVVVAGCAAFQYMA